MKKFLDSPLDITSQTIRDLMFTYGRTIHEFIDNINRVLPTEFRPSIEKGIFHLEGNSEKSWAYEDDGNTRTDAVDYHAIWSFPLCEVSTYQLAAVERGVKGYALLTLHFHFKATERLRDGKCGYHFFEGILSKVEPLDRYLSKDKKHFRFCMENDSHKPGIKLNRLIIAQVAKEIIELHQLYRIYQVIEGTGEKGLKIAHHIQHELNEKLIREIEKNLE